MGRTGGVAGSLRDVLVDFVLKKHGVWLSEEPLHEKSPNCPNKAWKKGQHVYSYCTHRFLGIFGREKSQIPVVWEDFGKGKMVKHISCKILMWCHIKGMKYSKKNVQSTQFIHKRQQANFCSHLAFQQFIAKEMSVFAVVIVTCMWYELIVVFDILG